MKKYTTETFIAKATLIHDNYYTYTDTLYSLSTSKVIITCPIHGNFEQEAAKHLQGYKCWKCGVAIGRTNILLNAKRKFTDKAKKVHNDMYTYDLSTYVNAATNILINCPVHGDFEQIPKSHLQGRGCPGCAVSGFNQSKPAILYYLQVKEGIFKIGITNRTIKQRYTAKDSYTVINEWYFKIGADAYQLEQKLLKDNLRYKYFGPRLLSSGNSELITTNIINQLNNHIKEYNMKLRVTTNKEAIAESSGASFLNKSGVYDVTIDFASIAVSKGGAESVNFNITYNGKTQTLWGPYVTDKAGNDLEIGLKLINKLAIIAGAGEDEELSTDEQTHPVGKDNEEKEFTVIEQFSDLDVKVHVQEEYSRYGGNITEKLAIKAFFREDGASAEEIVNETEAGVRLALVEEKYANNITYAESKKGAGDAPTPEEVAEWKAAKAAARSGNAATTAKVNTSATKKSAIFGKK